MTRRAPRCSHAALTLLLPLVVPLLGGCGDANDEWYRAEQDNEGYVIYRAGLGDDSCLVIFVGDTPDSGPEQAPLEHIDGEVGPYVWAREFEGADHCGVGQWNSGDFTAGGTPVTQWRGTLRFSDNIDEFGLPQPCTIEIAGSIGGRLLDARVPINRYYGRCPLPDRETFEVDVLGASSPNTRDDFLALRAWNEDLEVCYGLDFELYDSDNDDLVVPEGWRLTDASMVVFGTKEDCSQGTWPVPSEDNGFEPASAWPLRDTARGQLVFDVSQPWINPNDDTPTPCEISVDVSVDFHPFLHWTPTTLRFVGENIPVAQTCGR